LGGSLAVERKNSGDNDLQNTYQKAKAKGLNYVSDYWKEERQDETWRVWKKPNEWDININPE